MQTHGTEKKKKQKTYIIPDLMLIDSFQSTFGKKKNNNNKNNDLKQKHRKIFTSSGDYPTNLQSKQKEEDLSEEIHKKRLTSLFVFF